MSEPAPRPDFRLWIDKQSKPTWSQLPLTHISKSLIARDIVREQAIKPVKTDEVAGEPVSFFFYGRPAYRVQGDGAIKTEAACPFLFIFDPRIMQQAENIHALDTGAYGRRMYDHVLMTEMNVEDFSLETDVTRPDKLIAATYGSPEAYFHGDTSKIPEAEKITDPDDFLARAYVQLLKSNGRNEPDDRVGTIEVTFKSPLELHGNLRAVIVPDTLWSDAFKSDWIAELSKLGVDVRVFRYTHGRNPDYYQHALEREALEYYQSLALL